MNRSAGLQTRPVERTDLAGSETGAPRFMVPMRANFGVGAFLERFDWVCCPRCRQEVFVPFSCRVRRFCPASHQKRALEKADRVAEHYCVKVPQRQFVFMIALATGVNRNLPIPVRNTTGKKPPTSVTVMMSSDLATSRALSRAAFMAICRGKAGVRCFR